MPPATWQNERAALDGTVPGPLTPAQIDQYYEDGYLVLDGMFTEQLPALRTDIEQLISNLATKLHEGGLVSSTYADKSWTERLLALQTETDAAIQLIKGGILPPAFRTLYEDPRILDVAAQLGVGKDCAVSPAWNIRAKMPSHDETVVAWHCDNSYWEPRIWGDHVITCWVALVDVDMSNGCMQFLRKAHKRGVTPVHTIGTTTRTWYTELTNEEMGTACYGRAIDATQDVFTAVVPAGTAIVFPGTLPHRSVTSSAQNVRWATDFRIHRASAQLPSTTGRGLDFFYGLKDSLQLRDAEGKPCATKEQWDAWANVDRTAAQDDALKSEGDGCVGAGAVDAAAATEFDSTIVGPWMDLWDIRTETLDGVANKHTRKYVDTPEEKRSIEPYKEAGHW